MNTCKCDPHPAGTPNVPQQSDIGAVVKAPEAGRNTTADKKELREMGFGVEACGFGDSAEVYFDKESGKPFLAMSWLDGELTGFSVQKELRRKGLATAIIKKILKDDPGSLLVVVDPNKMMMGVLNKAGTVVYNDNGTATVTAIVPAGSI